MILAVQLSLPVSRLGDQEIPPRFGWQMFSRTNENVGFVAVTQAGEEGVRLDRYVAKLRADVPLVRALPPHLCNVIDDINSVRWEGGEFRCASG